jgi:hypothetical protein
LICGLLLKLHLMSYHVLALKEIGVWDEVVFDECECHAVTTNIFS